jgi:hypothetical protein
VGEAKGLNRYRRPLASASLPSVDLAGRAVALSRDVPVAFDVPLAPHHRMIGRWVAARGAAEATGTRIEARRHIEREFDEAVLAILKRCNLVNLRALALCGNVGMPPALALICDDVGQINLGWIEKSNVLSDTLFTAVAPVGWRAAAYRALLDTLCGTLPVFGYDELLEEVSAYYWDGETTDEGARKALIEWHGHEADDLEGMTLPSGMDARRPDFMLAKNAAPLKDMPADLCHKLRALRAAHKALKAAGPDGHAWRFEFDRLVDYIPGFEDASHLPPLTLVPFDQFARELDDVARHGMEQGFMDVAGLCALTEPSKVDDWLASLKLGVDVLCAAQDLIEFDPAKG